MFLGAPLARLSCAHDAERPWHGGFSRIATSPRCLTPGRQLRLDSHTILTPRQLDGLSGHDFLTPSQLDGLADRVFSVPRPSASAVFVFRFDFVTCRGIVVGTLRLSQSHFAHDFVLLEDRSEQRALGDQLLVFLVECLGHHVAHETTESGSPFSVASAKPVGDDARVAFRTRASLPPAAPNRSRPRPIVPPQAAEVRAVVVPQAVAVRAIERCFFARLGWCPVHACARALRR